MQIRVRKINKGRVVRLETSGEIKEVLINEDILKPNNESVSICFRGKNSSGIIDFSPNEIESLFKSVKNRIHLIKGFKILTDKK